MDIYKKEENGILMTATTCFVSMDIKSSNSNKKKIDCETKTQMKKNNKTHKQINKQKTHETTVKQQNRIRSEH